MSKSKVLELQQNSSEETTSIDDILNETKEQEATDKMGYAEFKYKVLQYFQEKFGQNARIDIRRILKNNAVYLDGLSMLFPGDTLSPTIYLKAYYDLYQTELSFDEVVRIIENAYHNNRRDKSLDVSFFKQFTHVKEQIVFKLINYEQNLELLRSIPHRRYLDFAIVYYCLISDDTLGNATITIYNSHLQMWDKTEEDLFEIARKNTPDKLPCVMMEITQIIDEMTKESDNDSIYGKESIDACFFRESNDNNFPHMYVLTNKNRTFGAIAMLYPGVLEYFSDKIQSDLFILPSSIHEIILVPKNTAGKKDVLETMVQEVNDEQVEEEEILSYQVYEYNRSSRAILLQDQTETVAVL